MDIAGLLLLGVLVGGMVTFQVLFAPLIFITLETKTARRFIRNFFPYYYLYFGILNGVAVVIFYLADQTQWMPYLLASLAGFMVARQILMPRANHASDSGNTSRFNLLHRTTVLINSLQLVTFVGLFIMQLVG